jgi:PAS domain S-box-containing protein
MADRKRRSERDRSSGAVDHLERIALLDEIESQIEAAVWLQELDPLRTIHASRAYEAIWGRSLDALYRNPRDWIEAVHPEDRPRVEAAYERLLRGEAFDQRYRILRPDGEVRWIRDRGSPLRTAGGISARVARVAEDVTENMGTERALRLMSSVFSDGADPILIADLAGTVIDCNAAAQQTYGWTRDELLGETIKTVVPRECHTRADELLERCRAGDEVRNAERLCRNKRGDVIPVLLTLSLLTDEQGQPLGIAAIAKDISALKDAESRRRAASRAAEDAEARERRALARDLHDAVSQSLSLARIKLATLRGEAGATDAARCLRDVEALVADAEERTRTLTFRLSPPTLQDVGLAAALEWLAEDMVRRFGLHVVVSDDKLPKPLGAEAREALFRSLRELLINVARHARTDKASVSLIREDAALTVTVEDAGIGFDRGQSGGFGLVSVRERVEGLGGRLEIESERHRGTRVRMVVPLSPAAPG